MKDSLVSYMWKGQGETARHERLMGDREGFPVSKGILAYAKSRFSKSVVLSPHFGEIDGVKDGLGGIKVHAESGFVKDFQEGRERV